MKPKLLQFQFKGARDYVQGPDMWNQTFEFMREHWPSEQVGKFDFTIHKMTGHNLWIATVLEPTHSRPIATIEFELNGQNNKAFLVEDDSSPKTRIAYDESLVTSICEIDTASRSAILKSSSPYSNLETLVSMTKALHLEAFPGATGKWVFCRLLANAWPLDPLQSGTKVTITQFFGTRLTKVSVEIEESEVATIFFSAKVTS